MRCKYYQQNSPSSNLLGVPSMTKPRSLSRHTSANEMFTEGSMNIIVKKKSVVSSIQSNLMQSAKYGNKDLLKEISFGSD